MLWVNNMGIVSHAVLLASSMVYNKSMIIPDMDNLETRLAKSARDWEIANNKKFNYSALARACGASKQAVQGWKNGSTKTIDDLDVLIKAAKYLGVEPHWLNGTVLKLKTDRSLKNIDSHTNPIDYVPLISWVTAGNWQETIDLNEPGIGEELIPCSKSHSPNSYALTVQGESMTHSGQYSFPHGMVIIVDPEQAAYHSDFVIAKIKGEQEATFKQLIIDGSRQYLKPLNPQYPTITDEFTVIGKVIQAVLTL